MAFLYQDYYRLARDTGNLHIWRKYITDLAKRINDDGEAVYVSFRDPRRKGSIGRIKKLVVEEKAYHTSYSYYSRSSATPAVNVPVVKEIHVGWDGRKNLLKPDPRDINLEEEATGTAYIFEQTLKEKVPAKVVLDQLGEPVNPGDFVSFIHRRYGRVCLKFGTITRITNAGTVFVQTLKVRDGERSEELRCKDNDLVIVSNQLMNRLTLAKLAAN